MITLCLLVLALIVGALTGLGCYTLGTTFSRSRGVAVDTSDLDRELDDSVTRCVALDSLAMRPSFRQEDRAFWSSYGTPFETHKTNRLRYLDSCNAVEAVYASTNDEDTSLECNPWKVQ